MTGINGTSASTASSSASTSTGSRGAGPGGPGGEDHNGSAASGPASGSGPSRSASTGSGSSGSAGRDGGGAGGTGSGSLTSTEALARGQTTAERLGGGRSASSAAREKDADDGRRSCSGRELPGSAGLPVSTTVGLTVANSGFTLKSGFDEGMAVFEQAKPAGASLASKAEGEVLANRMRDVRTTAREALELLPHDAPHAVRGALQEAADLSKLASKASTAAGLAFAPVLGATEGLVDAYRSGETFGEILGATIGGGLRECDDSLAGVAGTAAGTGLGLLGGGPMGAAVGGIAGGAGAAIAYENSRADVLFDGYADKVQSSIASTVDGSIAAVEVGFRTSNEWVRSVLGRD